MLAVTNFSSATKYVLQDCMYLQDWSLQVSHMNAEQNIKKKYHMSQIPIKMLTKNAIPNSSLHNLNIYSSKGCKKTSQGPKMNYL